MLRLLFDALSPILGTVGAAVVGEWYRARMARRNGVLR